ncbi:MAG: 30S ribosome-binding factor RbfA [bacterium]
MSKKRINRVSSLLRDQISKIVLTKIKDPRLGFVTITDVEISGDLKEAKIFTSVLGNEYDKKISIEVLKHAVPFIKNQLNSMVELKFMPTLEFILDDSLEKSDRINRVLKDLNFKESNDKNK